MKVRVKLALLVLVILTGLYLGRNILLKSAIEFYLNKKLHLSASLNSAAISPGSLVLNNLSLSDESFTFDWARAEINFSLADIFSSPVSKVSIYNANIDIKDLERMRQFLNKALPPEASSAAASAKLPAYDIYLDNTGIKLSIAPGSNLEVSFSLAGRLGSNRLETLEYIKISRLNFKADGLNLAARLEPVNDKHVLYVDRLNYKDQRLDAFSLGVSLDADELMIHKSSLLFFGQDAYVEGALDYRDYANICLRLKLSQSSFRQAVVFFGADESFYFDGPFSGALDCCFSQGELSDISGFFESAGQGLIRIEKDIGLDFLKERLDKKSYNTLVDSFRNYQYNNGKISVKSQADVLSLRLDFNSPAAGKRDILINYYYKGVPKADDPSLPGKR